MKKLKDILNISSNFVDNDKREHQLEIQNKINHLLISMSMRLVLHSYSLPEQISFITCKLREIYNNIKQLDALYIDAIKKAEYTDWILQNRVSVDEEKEKFLNLSKELYDEIAKFDEAPICIRENYFMLKAEITNLEYSKDE